MSPFGLHDWREITAYNMPVVELVGIQQLDYLDLFRKFAYTYGTKESYSLNNIAHIVLNEKKLDFPEVVQVLLGVLLDTAKEVVSLKPGFVKELLVLIEETLKAVGSGKARACKLADSFIGRLTFYAYTSLPPFGARSSPLQST